MENQKTEENKSSEKPVQSTKDILNAFRREFSTTVHSIYVNSLQREVRFREITVSEQKTLSKTTMENENRKDIVYDTQCQLINQLCLEDGFDVYKLTEFDRIRILMEIYQMNYFKSDIKYKCTSCGRENVYKLDFQNIVDRMNKFTLEPEVFTTEDPKRIFKFKINYPLVRTVSNFYKDYMKKYKGNVNNVERQVLDNLGNIEYINLFISEIEMIEKDDPTQRMTADLSLMTYSEVESLIDLFPQNVIFAETNGVLGYIADNFINKLNDAFRYEKCQFCGAETTEGVGSLVDFF